MRTSSGWRHAYQRYAGFRWSSAMDNSNLARRRREPPTYSKTRLVNQKVNRHAKRASELLLQFGGSFAPAIFDFRQVVLTDPDRHRQFALNHVSPFAEDAHRVFASCEAIGDGFGQRDVPPFPKRARGIAHDPARGGIFLSLSGEGYQPVIFAARQYGEIVSTRRMNELDVAFYSTSFCHGVLSLINIAAVSDCVNRDRIALDREQDAPVTRPQPHARRSLERLHVADPGSANVFNLRSICARVVAVSLRHWRIAAEVNSISFTSHVSHNAMLKSKRFRIVRYWIAAPWIQLPAWHALTGRGRHAGFGWYARFRNGLCD